MSRSIIITALVALVAGFGGAALWSLSGLGDAQVRRYLVANPEILPEMAAAFQQREARERLARTGDAVSQAFPGAVLGNPDGSVTLVEFSDYACTYCRASMPHVEALIAANPELKVVVREWPIFEGSDVATRMALAAGLQGKYRAFHDAMFATGDVTAAAKAAGLDMARAERDAASDAVSTEIARNLDFARSLGFTGTPAWIAGKTPFGGAVGYEKLKAALAASTEAR